jgi:putative ABC transport system ATP-binding protein
MKPAGDDYAIDIQDLHYAWPGQQELLSINSLRIAHGSTVLLQGPSGSGKTTLLSLITGVLTPSRGEIKVLGHDFATLSPAQRDVFRGESMGIIFQMFNLLPFLTVLDNVLLPLRLFSKRRGDINTLELMKKEALRLITALGLDESILTRQSYRLSVGQQQRVAAARALIGKPPLILADEPTSALDEAAQAEFLSLLITQVQQTQTTLLMVSHDSRLAPQFDQVVRL